MAELKVVDEKVLDNRKVIMQTIEGEYFAGEQTHKIILPEISDEELLARYIKINPLVKEKALYYYLKKFNLDQMRNQSYLWDIHEDKREQVDMTCAKTIAEFSCYHTYGYYGFFKPSIAEVLQQFPDDVLSEANAFYMFESPETMDDLGKQWDIVNAGCQRSKVKALVLKK